MLTPWFLLTLGVLVLPSRTLRALVVVAILGAVNCRVPLQTRAILVVIDVVSRAVAPWLCSCDAPGRCW